MNPDEFENALLRDIASVPRPDPTPAWKAAILARAAAPPARRRITLPRLILAAWAACWAFTFALHSATPTVPTSFAHASPPSTETDLRTLETRRAAMLSLLASNDSSTLPRP